MTHQDDETSSIIVRLIGGSSLALAGTVLTKGLNLVFQVLLGRYLGPTVYGWFTVGQSFLTVGKSISLFGLHNSVTKFVSQYYGEEDYANAFATLSFSALVSGSFSLIISLVIVTKPTLVSVGIFNNPEITSTIQILSLLLPVHTLIQISKSFLQAVQKFSWMSISHVSGSFFEVVFILLVGYLGLRYETVLWLIVLSSLLSLIIALTMVTIIIYYKLSWDGFTMKPKKILRFGIPLFFSGIAFTFMSKIDIFLIEFFGQSDSVGVYNAALLLSGIISLPLTGLNQAISPIISDLYNQNKKTELTETLQWSTRWISTVGLGFGIIFFIFSDEIILLWGEDYYYGGVFLSILVIPKIVNAVTGSSGFVLQMTEHQDLALVNNITSLVVNIILDIILIPRYGPIGAAIGTAVALSLNNILCLIEVNVLVGLSMNNASIFRAIFSGFLVLIVGQLLGNTAIIWELQIVFIVIIFSVLSVALLTKRDKDLLRKIIKQTI
jgi:O-antigen/teichoic acid export membrane protein